MASNQKSASPEEPNSPWVGLVQFLLSVLFVVMCYMLVQSMVRHHFLRAAIHKSSIKTDSTISKASKNCDRLWRRPLFLCFQLS
jgi:hypothetical protein